MTDPSSDERLSAYLDGELSAAEQAQLERQLADSAELRQLLDDLRALRGGMESLPKYKLDDDFASRVLRRAEQAMLTSAAAEQELHAAAAAPGDDGHVSNTGKVAPAANPAARTFERWKSGGVRTWGWAAAAIAAALVIMVLDREPGVVQKPTPSSVPSGRGAEWIATDEGRHAATPGDMAKTGPTVNQPVAGKADVGAVATSDALTGGAGAAQDQGVPAGSFAGPAVSGSARPAPNTIAVDENSIHEKKAEARKESPQNTPLDALGVGEMLVVNCTVTREAVAQRQFDRLLTQQQIVVEKEGKEESDTTQGQRSQGAGSAPNAPAAPPAAGLAQQGPRASQSAGGLVIAEKNDAAEKSKATVDREADLDAVLVDATAGQVNAVLNDLNQNPGWFPTIQVDPAPQAPAQQSLTVYNRGLTLRRDAVDLAKAAVQPEARPQTLQAPAGAGEAGSNSVTFGAQAANNEAFKRANTRSRAQRFRPESAQEAQNLAQSRSQSNLSLNFNNAAEPDGQKPAEAAQNLGQAMAGKPSPERNQQQLVVDKDLNKSLADGRAGANAAATSPANEESAPVRALFLLRVVDSPTTAPAAAPGTAPATQPEMSR